jgi:hypothetical protein
LLPNHWNFYQSAVSPLTSRVFWFVIYFWCVEDSSFEEKSYHKDFVCPNNKTPLMPTVYDYFRAGVYERKSLPD